MNIFKKFFNWLVGLFKSKTVTTTPISVEPPKDEYPHPLPPVHNPDPVDPKPIYSGPAEEPFPPVSPKCLKYSVVYGGGPESPIGVVTYLDCKGTLNTTGVNWERPHISFCALEGTVQTTWSGDKVIVDGECTDTRDNDVSAITRSIATFSEGLVAEKPKKSKTTKKPKTTKAPAKKKTTTKPKKK